MSNDELTGVEKALCRRWNVRPEDYLKAKRAQAVEVDDSVELKAGRVQVTLSEEEQLFAKKLGLTTQEFAASKALAAGLVEEGK